MRFCEYSTTNVHGAHRAQADDPALRRCQRALASCNSMNVLGALEGRHVEHNVRPHQCQNLLAAPCVRLGTYVFSPGSLGGWPLRRIGAWFGLMRSRSRSVRGRFYDSSRAARCGSAARLLTGGAGSLVVWSRKTQGRQRRERNKVRLKGRLFRCQPYFNST